MIHQRHRQTNGQTDDMRFQDRALHYSASRGKNTTYLLTCLSWYVSDQAAESGTKLRDSHTEEDRREPSIYQPGTHYSRASIQSTMETDHYDQIQETPLHQEVETSPDIHQEFGEYLEILPAAAYVNVEAETVPAVHREPDDDDDDDDHYDKPEVAYDHLDISSVIHRQTTPTTPVYNRLTH